MLIGTNDAALFNLMTDHSTLQISQRIGNSLVTINACVPSEFFKVYSTSHPIFSKDFTDIGRITAGEHHIRLKDGVAPIALQPYRNSERINDLVRQEVNKMLEANVIRPSVSPWAFPTTMVKKSDGTLRFCGDYRRLNAVTVDEHTPLPFIPDLIDKVAKKHVFSTIDLISGYWQVPMAPDSIEKTAFITADGQYEFIVMPFGLKNAPSTFQRIILRLIRPLQSRGVHNYLDDIIVFTDTIEEHNEVLCQLFDILHKSNLRVKRTKCTFFAVEIDFLGFHIAHNVKKPKDDKVQAIISFPTPHNAKKVAGFLGMVNYYRCFVKDFAKTALPLYQLTNKDTPFEWKDVHQTAFDLLKEPLTKEPFLVPFYPHKPTRLVTDASGIGIGAVLCQLEDKTERVVEFHSRKLSDTESRYSAPELECLAVYDSVKRFGRYLDNVHFELVTDCAALKWLKEVKCDKNKRLFRWSTLLSAYDYDTVHRPGKANVVADCLSRNPVHFTIVDYSQYLNEISHYDIRLKKTEKDGRIYVIIDREEKLVVPPSLRMSLLAEYHDNSGHPGQSRTHKIIGNTDFWFPNWSQFVKDYVNSCHTCQLVKPPNRPPQGLLQPLVTPSEPNDTWAIDTICVGNDASKTKYKYVQVIVDHFSRYAWAKATAKNTAEAAIESLSHAIKKAKTCPKHLICDNGPNFRSKTFRRFVHSKGITLGFTSAYRPQANGLCERLNGSLARHISLIIVDRPKIQWTTALTSGIKDYNRLPHTVTGMPPQLLHFGIGLSQDDSLDLIKTEALKRSRRQQIDRKAAYERRHGPSQYELGDKVIIRLPPNHPRTTKFSPRYDGPYVITKQVAADTYKVSRCQTSQHQPKILPDIVTSNAYRLRPYFDRSQFKALHGA